MDFNFAEMFWRLLQLLEVRAIRDEEGDWRLAVDGVPAFARVRSDGPFPFVCVWTVAAEGVGPGCLPELNRLNAHAPVGHFVHTDQCVLVVADLPMAGLNAESLRVALMSVVALAKKTGPLLGPMFAQVAR